MHDVLSSTTMQPMPSTRLWKPHGSMEASERELIIEDGEFGGLYRFRHGSTCQTSNCTITFPVENENICTISSCLVTQKGLKGKTYPVPNQDKSVLIETLDNQEYFLAVLADGHGILGHLVSEATSEELPLQLLKNIDQGNDIKSSIHSAFLETDRGKLSYVPRGGTTAIVVYQNASKVYIASAGDSTAMIVQWKKPSPASSLNSQANILSQEEPSYRIVASAKKHKPMDPDERARIEANGGTVYVPRLITRNETAKFSSLSIEDANRGGRVIYTIPGPPPMQMGLAMSRSLGDLPAKRQKLVIPDPDIVTIDLMDFENDDTNQGSQYFVILATDGIMDRLEVEEVVIPLGNTLFDESNGKSGISLYETCQSILEKAAFRWSLAMNGQYRDDMSLTVKKIEYSIRTK